MLAVMHCHIRQVKYPPESQFETEMTLQMPILQYLPNSTNSYKVRICRSADKRNLSEKKVPPCAQVSRNQWNMYQRKPDSCTHGKSDKFVYYTSLFIVQIDNPFQKQFTLLYIIWPHLPTPNWAQIHCNSWRANQPIFFCYKDYNSSMIELVLPIIKYRPWPTWSLQVADRANYRGVQWSGFAQCVSSQYWLMSMVR